MPIDFSAVLALLKTAVRCVIGMSDAPSATHRVYLEALRAVRAAERGVRECYYAWATVISAKLACDPAEAAVIAEKSKFYARYFDEARTPIPRAAASDASAQPEPQRGVKEGSAFRIRTMDLATPKPPCLAAPIVRNRLPCKTISLSDPVDPRRLDRLKARLGRVATLCTESHERVQRRLAALGRRLAAYYHECKRHFALIMVEEHGRRVPKRVRITPGDEAPRDGAARPAPGSDHDSS